MDDMRRSVWKLVGWAGPMALSLALLPLGGVALAYPQWSIDDDPTYCGFCHGDFRSSSYTGRSDGQPWGNLHNIHRQDMVGGECQVCHGNDTFPVQTGVSSGVPGLPAISCASGCHGREEDADPAGTGSQGYGLALQRRHELANVGPGHDGNTCKDCHLRADPASGANPVGEDVFPPYYANASYPTMPSDPCNPAGSEDYAGATQGLDNDGDFVYDMSDPNCSGPAQTPGEVSGDAQAALTVTAHDSTAETLEIEFDPGCETTSLSLHFGPLSSVATPSYSGQICDIGSTSPYTWDYSLAPSSSFFLVVGHNGTNEGSYGLKSVLVERSPNPACARPQDLANRCD